MSRFFRKKIHAPKRENVLSFLSLTQIFLITCGVPTDILLPIFESTALLLPISLYICKK